MEYITYHTSIKRPSTAIIETEADIVVRLHHNRRGTCISVLPVLHNKIYNYPLCQTIISGASLDEMIKETEDIISKSTYETVLVNNILRKTVTNINIGDFFGSPYGFRIYKSFRVFERDIISTIIITQWLNSYPPKHVSKILTIGRNEDKKCVVEHDTCDCEQVTTLNLRYKLNLRPGEYDVLIQRWDLLNY